MDFSFVLSLDLNALRNIFMQFIFLKKVYVKDAIKLRGANTHLKLTDWYLQLLLF